MSITRYMAIKILQHEHYFIVETKGRLGLELRPVEDAKIKCAKKLFNKMSTSVVRYEAVTSYQDLLNKMNSLG